MATHWRRHHSQLTDLLPDSYHQHHLNSSQYDCLTQGQEATGCHYHTIKPGFIPLVFDGTSFRTEGTVEIYPYGFPCRGFGTVITPTETIRLGAGSTPANPHGGNPPGWTGIWARGGSLYYGLVLRVYNWETNARFYTAKHDDINTQLRYASYIDLATVNAARPFAFLFGNGVTPHVTRISVMQDMGTGTSVELEVGLPEPPANPGQWVYLAPVDRPYGREVTASYVASFWVNEKGDPDIGPFRTVGAGIYTWERNFYYNGSSDAWVDADLTAIVPPTTMSFDISIIATRFSAIVGVYRTYNDPNSLIKASTHYNSFTALPDGNTYACGNIPEVCPAMDNYSSLHVYLWCTSQATLRVTKIREF